MPMTREQIYECAAPRYWLRLDVDERTAVFITEYPISEYNLSGSNHPNITMLQWTEDNNVNVEFDTTLDGRAQATILYHSYWNWSGYPSDYNGLCMLCGHSVIPVWPSDDIICCLECQRTNTCSHCDIIDVEVQYNDFNDYYMCPNCYEEWALERVEREETYDSDPDEYYEEEREYHRGSRLIEKFDDYEVNTPEAFLLTKLPHRPIRFHSLEIEFGGSGNAAASRLYTAGLSRFDSMCGYHGGNAAHLRVEHDSTVDGELIIPFLQPDYIDDATKLHKTLDIMRNLVKDEKVFPDSRCGNHHHVSAKGMDVKHIRHLVEIFGYLEDPLYRIASANWESHRLAQGNDYASPIIKGEWRDDIDFGRSVLRNDCRGTGHSNALNLSNYYRAMRDCGCGAREFGEWGKCECRLSKDTIEFRLFNTTLSSRKMHAYMALTQSLVAAAQQKRPTERLPYMEYQYGDDLPSLKDPWMERLRWIFKYVPLEGAERQNVLYCIENSDMKDILSSQFLSALQRTEYEGPTDEVVLPKGAFKMIEEETNTEATTDIADRIFEIAHWIRNYNGEMPPTLTQRVYQMMAEELEFRSHEHWNTYNNGFAAYAIPSAVVLASRSIADREAQSTVTNNLWIEHNTFNENNEVRF